MDFDFKKDYFSNKATAKISMGHEAFGTWLEQEGQEKSWVKALLMNIQKVQSRELNEFKLIGSEFALYLTSEDAKIVNHSLNDVDTITEDDNALSFYDQEIQAECGLEDFMVLIESWLAFI